MIGTECVALAISQSSGIEFGHRPASQPHTNHGRLRQAIKESLERRLLCLFPGRDNDWR